MSGLRSKNYVSKCPFPSYSSRYSALHSLLFRPETLLTGGPLSTFVEERLEVQYEMTEPTKKKTVTSEPINELRHCALQIFLTSAAATLLSRLLRSFFVCFTFLFSLFRFLPLSENGGEVVSDRS